MNKFFPNSLQNNVKDWNRPCHGLEWSISDSTVDSILMVDLRKSLKSHEITNKLLNAKYAYLITTSVTVLQKCENVILIDSNAWNQTQKKLCDDFYPLDEKKKFVGITGTNGKSTTADLCLQISHGLGINSISVGTLGIRAYQKTLHDFSLTTPNYIELRKQLFKYKDQFDFCFMELSSHALEQERIHSLKLECAAWTSFSQDHLDYHLNMEDYFKAKAKIYSMLKPSGKLFVSKDELFESLKQFSQTVLKKPVMYKNLPLFFKADYNLENLANATAICEFLGMKLEKLAWEKLLPPPGRFNIIPYKNNYIVIDFAHTADAIENICKALKKNFSDKKLKIVFGCGGDRDRTKRPKMGEVAEKYCDYIYVTSDNPRSEEPMQIINDVIKGIKNQDRMEIEPDRKKTVANAIKNLDGDVLLIAGKGHENYIHIGNIKHPYSDETEVLKNIGQQ